LIAQAQGVITITGTAGMEAMLMGKPAITLGDVFYTFVEGLVERATSLETLPNLVKWFDTFKADEQLLQTFVAAILDESVEVDPEVLALRFLNMPLGQIARP
jgi:capsular polysaccharide export protein